MLGDLIFGRLLFMPLDLLVGNKAIRILTANDFQNALAIKEWRVWT
jgi:hypothetical protein